MTEAVIVATARSPIGRANKGSLVSMRPDDLSAQIVKALLAKVPQVQPGDVEDLIMGCGQPAGEAGFNIARVVAVLAGLDDVPGVTVNRYCSSSLQTIRMAAHAISAGEGDCFIAAGVRPVSRYGEWRERHRTEPGLQAVREAHRERSQGGRARGRRRRACRHLHRDGADRGERGRRRERAREDMDAFAKRSQDLASANQANGFFDEEITPITLEDGTVVSKDDGPRGRGTTMEALGELEARLPPDGKFTAGNACPLNDGAAAVLVMSDTRARQLGITPLARIVASGVTWPQPEIMGLGPIEACRQAMKRAGMTIDDIDLVEINEAFAAQVVPSAKHLDIPWEKLNVHGGGIALGHPFGMTGARIMTTLIHGLQHDNKTIGMESMCVGGGQGMAMIVERLS
jgi:acetyl-CoA C-acetyltransferase